MRTERECVEESEESRPPDRRGLELGTAVTCALSKNNNDTVEHSTVTETSPTQPMNDFLRQTAIIPTKRILVT
jgi:hypothetical protein